MQQCLYSENVLVNFVLSMWCFIVECALVWVKICSFIVNFWYKFTKVSCVCCVVSFAKFHYIVYTSVCMSPVYLWTLCVTEDGRVPSVPVVITYTV